MRKLVHDSEEGRSPKAQRQAICAAGVCIAVFSSFAPLLGGCGEARNASPPQQAAASARQQEVKAHRNPCADRKEGPSAPRSSYDTPISRFIFRGEKAPGGLTDADILRAAKNRSWGGIGIADLIGRIERAQPAEQRALTLALAVADSALAVRDYYESGKSLPQHAIYTLAELTYHEDAEVRRGAAGILGQTRLEMAVPAIVERLSDADPAVRRRAVISLSDLAGSGIDTAFAALADARKNEDPAVRREVALWLRIRNNPAAVPALIEMLEDGDANVRRLAVEGLGFIRDRSALDPLIRHLDDPDGMVRSGAQFNLAQTPYRGPKVRAALIRLLDNPDAEERCEALIDVWAYHDRETLAAVTRMQHDGNARVRACASKILEDFRTPHEPLTPLGDLREIHRGDLLLRTCSGRGSDGK
jgi:HEAT repeat protein